MDAPAFTHTHARTRVLQFILETKSYKVKISKIVYLLLKQFSTLKVTKIHRLAKLTSFAKLSVSGFADPSLLQDAYIDIPACTLSYR